MVAGKNGFGGAEKGSGRVWEGGVALGGGVGGWRERGGVGWVGVGRSA